MGKIIKFIPKHREVKKIKQKKPGKKVNIIKISENKKKIITTLFKNHKLINCAELNKTKKIIAFKLLYNKKYQIEIVTRFNKIQFGFNKFHKSLEHLKYTKKEQKNSLKKVINLFNEYLENSRNIDEFIKSLILFDDAFYAGNENAIEKVYKDID